MIHWNKIKKITNSSEHRKFYWKYHSEAEYFRRRKFQKSIQEEDENIDEFEDLHNSKVEIPFK